MSDDQSKRAQQVTLNERPSTTDRVKQVQQLQRAMETQQARPAEKTVRTTAANAPRQAVKVFDVADVRRAGGEKLGLNKVTTDPTVYARAQVDPAKLFGGEQLPELVGNPWKVISFETMLPVVFDTPKPIEQYSAKLPDQAAKTDQGLLFNVTLEPKAKGDKTIQRAVLTNDKGDLKGAECRNAGELNKLLTRSSSILDQLFASAFGDGSGAKLVNVQSSRKSAFEVTVQRNDEVKTVPVNNFGLPIPAGMDPQDANILVANYFRDSFQGA